MTPVERVSKGPSLGRLAFTGVTLLALAGASYALSFAALGGLGLPFALGIAACKALVVLFVFMEFGALPASARLAAGAALLMFLLLLGLTVADVATREPAPLPAPKVEPVARVRMLARPHPSGRTGRKPKLGLVSKRRR